ncbi:hypothetical protein O9992_07190 [Vibrio lentus]|nr:hypothetical protein [Vibrio lentus]
MGVKLMEITPTTTVISPIVLILRRYQNPADVQPQPHHRAAEFEINTVGWLNSKMPRTVHQEPEQQQLAGALRLNRAIRWHRLKTTICRCLI